MWKRIRTAAKAVQDNAVMAGLASLLILASPAIAVPSAVATAPERITSLNGPWSFALASTDAERQALSGFHQQGFDASRFRPLPVPSNWLLHGYDTPTYGRFKGEGAQGHYLRRLTSPSGWRDQRVLLHFGGVWSSAEVWLNGTPLGRHDSGFTPFAFDISGHLKDGDNLLAVKVRQTHPGYLLDTNDDWSLGGIYRDVWLETTPKQRWLDRIEVRTTFDDQYRDADLQVRVMVGDTSSRPSPGNFQVAGGTPYTLRLTLLDAAGEEVVQRDTAVPGHAGTGRDTGIGMRIAEPLHWTAETPNLYRLRVELLEAGKPAHTREVNVGFRQVSTTGGVFRINGQAVKLRGVNRHEEHPDVGRATTPEHWLRDIRMMKAANVNYIRLAHYPPAKGFLDLCDRLGMYVSNEVSMGYGGDDLHDPAMAGAVMVRAQASVTRDINHPSIVIWSVGNEDPLTSNHMNALRTVKALDPTRPVLMPWRAEHWLPPEIDILAPHYFDAGINDRLGAAASRPVVTTEFSHAYGNEAFGGLEERWDALLRHPSGAGGAIWMWADQGLSLRRDGKAPAKLELTDEAFDGVVDSWRRPTRDYWETRAVYAQVRPAVTRLDYVAGQSTLRIPIRNDYDFTDLKAVRIGWKLFEDGTLLAEGAARLAGPPHAVATLEVPLTALQRVRANATYYVQVSAAQEDGTPISTNAVELRTAPVQQATAAAAPQVEESEMVTVSAGAVRYRFNPRTGQLDSVTAGGRTLGVGMKPVLWREFNPVEQWIASWSKWGELPDLNRAVPTVKNWQVKNGADGVELTASVHYVVDADNRYGVEYRYLVEPRGALRVQYRITPDVKARWVPFVGMSFTRAPELSQLRWLGLGPYDSYPNKRAAGYLGVWDLPLKDGMARETKATRWLELAGGAGPALRIENIGYVDVGAGPLDEVRILSAVRALPSKGRQPETQSQRLETRKGVYVGEFTLAPRP